MAAWCGAQAAAAPAVTIGGLHAAPGSASTRAALAPCRAPAGTGVLDDSSSILAAALIPAAAAVAVGAAGKRGRGSRGSGIRWSRRPQLIARKSKAELDDKDMDNLLMQAGLRNLLGVEENRMAQKLEEQCQVSTDLKRCMNDVEVKHKVALEEIDDMRASLEIAAAEKDKLEREADRLTAELEETKHALDGMKAKGAEHWAQKKALEAERDEALIQVEAANKRAKAAELKAEVEIKSARAEAAAAKEEAAQAKKAAEAQKAAPTKEEVAQAKKAAEIVAEATPKKDEGSRAPPPAKKQAAKAGNVQRRARPKGF